MPLLDFFALGQQFPALQPFLALVANLLGMTQVNGLWVALLVPTLILAVSMDRIFETRSSAACQRFDGKALVQDLANFYLQLMLALALPFALFSTVDSSEFIVLAQRFSQWIGLGSDAGAGRAWAPAVLLFAAFVVQDLLRYVCHRLCHRVAWLWELHKFHHSASSLSPVTVFREHPLVLILNAVTVTAATAVVMVLALVIWPGLQQQNLELVGGLWAFLFIKTQVLLAHYHRPISWGPLDRWLVTPAVHAIHHSADPRHFDRNFGTTFTLWDHLFGSYWQPTSDDLKELQVGVPGLTERIAHRWLPFDVLFGELTVRAWQQLCRSCKGSIGMRSMR